MTRAGQVPERVGEAGRPDDAARRPSTIIHLDEPPTVASSSPTHWRPYIETCIELFGADRCMVESNFPVEKMGIGYAGLFNALEAHRRPAHRPTRRRRCSAAPAKRVYRLAID